MTLLPRPGHSETTERPATLLTGRSWLPLALLLGGRTSTTSGFVPAPVWSAVPSAWATNTARLVTRQRVTNVPFEATVATCERHRPETRIDTTACSPATADGGRPLTVIVAGLEIRLPSRDHERACRTDVAAARGRIEEVGARECVRGPAGHVDGPDERQADELRPPAGSAVGVRSTSRVPRGRPSARRRSRSANPRSRPGSSAFRSRAALSTFAPRSSSSRAGAHVDQVAGLRRDERDVVDAARCGSAEAPPVRPPFGEEQPQPTGGDDARPAVSAMRRPAPRGRDRTRRRSSLRR